jgi:hypothetical protein
MPEQKKSFYSLTNLSTVLLVRVEAISRGFRHIKRASSLYVHHFFHLKIPRHGGSVKLENRFKGISFGSIDISGEVEIRLRDML